MKTIQWKYKNLTCAALIIFAVLTIADVVTTKIILALGGAELNAVLAPVIDHLVLIKMAAIILVSLFAVWCERTQAGTGPIPFTAAGIFAGAAVVWNVAALAAAGVI